MTISCSKGEHQESQKLVKRTTYVSNGINVERLNEMIANIEISKEHPFTVFTLGRICYQKNPELFNKIAEAMPDVRFVWIGDGELRDKLTAPNIEITGWVERADALEYSMQGDVFLLVSLWEGLPISLLEAMYMRKLCVVSDVIGNRDVIYSGENGYVCHNVDEFVEAVKTGMSDKAAKLVEHAYSDILNHYNTVSMAGKYKMVYEARGGGT